MLATALCLQGFIAPAASVAAQYWSLSCEVAYYAVAPLLARFERVAWTLLACSAMIDVLAVALRWPDHVYAVYGLTALRLAWLWVAGWLYHRHRRRPWAGAWLVGGVAVITCLANLGQNQSLAGPWPTPLVAGVALAIVLAPRIPLTEPLARVLRYLGDLSYPLYAVHLPVFIWLGLHKNVPPLASAALVIALAAAVHHGLERPLQRRWKAHRERPVTLDAAR
jgi:peptidoglycan/LPS O-acetylase OafA/YrhL